MGTTLAFASGTALRIRVGSAALLFLASARAAAADGQEDLLIKQGIERRRHDDDNGALTLFSKAYELHHAPRALAQMGLARMALGLWVQAETDLEGALAASRDPWIRKNTGVLHEALDRVMEHVGTLEVLGNPMGAEVVIGGEVRASLPMEKPVHLPTGEYKLEVRAPGYEAVKRGVQIVAGQKSRETVALVAVPVAAAAQPADPQPPPLPGSPPGVGIVKRPPPVVVSNPPVASPIAPPPVEPNRPRRPGLRTVGIFLGGTGVAAVAGGLLCGLEARAAGNANSAAGHVFDPNADSRGHTFQTLQYVGYGVGAALLVAGTTLFVLGSPSASDGGDGSRGVRVSFGPLSGDRGGLDGGVAALRGRF
jgi:hypothetical protein